MMAKLKIFINKILSITFEFKKVVLGLLYIGCLVLPFSILSGELPLVFYVAWLIVTVLLTLQQGYLYGVPLKNPYKK
ncbi:hypothetical protein ACSXDC_17370 (plasmid) [Clostridium perfringens]|uniref:hypothetical protein n=1 Tax=Clostridium perfringens TaxID=1502 RepID=UPI0013E3A3B6|nr:hypothetical protein [Clostridium perfringens]ELC8422691.1 hypothetical protein [Clostridium perfringens]NGT95944.1 hypothetical protein [Clostridium perfringens]